MVMRELENKLRDERSERGKEKKKCLFYKGLESLAANLDEERKNSGNSLSLLLFQTLSTYTAHFS